MAWNYALYVERIASAGKKEYPLPMYVNAWLKQPVTFWPGRYPSGGPLPQVLDVWRAAAPSIDFLAPDIYFEEFSWVCDEYTRSGNSLFIPETVGGELGAARAFYTFGEYDASLFAPFGIDNPRYAQNDPLDESYAVLESMSSTILENQGMGTMRGILVNTASPVQKFELGNYLIEVRMAGFESTGIDRNERTRVAGGLIINTGPDEFLAAGKGLDIFFTTNDSLMRTAVNAVDEGIFKDGKWNPTRRLNGDEVHASTYSGSGLKLPGDKFSIQKITLYNYK
jgi:hypothetical protein